jgi:hypothetical protein
VLGAEGATRDRFRREAAGLLTIHGDRASVDPAPWPEQGSVHVARAGADWLFAFGDRPSGAGVDRVMVVRGERQELLAAGRGLVAIDLRCDVRWCAILVDSPASGGTAWLGSVAEPAGAWQPLALPALAERPQHPLAVVRLPGADAEHPTGVVVAVADDVRLRFYALRVDRPPQEQSSLSAPHGVLAVSGGPRPAALVRAGDPGRDGCAATGAGALVARPEREAVALPGALPPTRGALHPIGDGAYLATWLAPDGCASARLLLFAAMVRADGTPAAPVTAVGDAADYAVAARGEDVDLWIAADRTVSYLPLDCRWLGPR